MRRNNFLQHTITLSQWPGVQPEVVSFSGNEAINHWYTFRILLASQTLHPCFESLVKSEAALDISHGNNKRSFSGIISSIQLLHAAGDSYFYQIKLVPKLFLLQYMHSNQVFLEKTVADIIGQLLADTGFSNAEYALRLFAVYPKESMTTQYKETHFHFLRRLIERNGIFFYFEQDGEYLKLIFADSNSVLREPAAAAPLRYDPHSGLESLPTSAVASSFESSWVQLPKQIRFRDYNYEKPELHPDASVPVSPQGLGERYFYGQRVRSNSEARRQAEIKAEELQSHEQLLTLKTFAPSVASGHLFTLQDHPEAAFNQSYLATRVRHFGNQSDKLSAATKSAYTSAANLLSEAVLPGRFSYSNLVSAVRADRQYRPPRIAHRVSTCGLIHAKIDATQSGQYAELDEQGRYKVELPFDLSGMPDGKASSWLRMTQPYGGSDHGMHFPVHKGTDVLLFCTDGDPSRPAIQGVAPNPDNASRVTQENQTMCAITTSGQNKLHMEDKEGSQGLVAASSSQNSFMRLGAAMDGGGSSGQGIEMGTEGNLLNKVQTNASDSITGNQKHTISGGSARIYKNALNSSVTGAANYSILGAQQHSCLGLFKENHNDSFRFFTPAYTANIQQQQTTATTIKIVTGTVKRDIFSEIKVNWVKASAYGAKTALQTLNIGITAGLSISVKGATASALAAKISVELELLSMKAICISLYGFKLEIGSKKGAFEVVKLDLWLYKDGTKETKGTIIEGIKIDTSSSKAALSSSRKAISALRVRF